MNALNEYCKIGFCRLTLKKESLLYINMLMLYPYFGALPDIAVPFLPSNGFIILLDHWVTLVEKKKSLSETNISKLFDISESGNNRCNNKLTSNQGYI